MLLLHSTLRLCVLTAACAGQFLRGVLDKVGVEPQVQRIGVFKSAGDQLLRTDMAPEQRQQLQALLDSVYQGFVSSVAAARGKTEEEVCSLICCELQSCECCHARAAPAAAGPAGQRIPGLCIICGRRTRQDSGRGTPYQNEARLVCTVLQAM